MNEQINLDNLLADHIDQIIAGQGAADLETDIPVELEAEIRLSKGLYNLIAPDAEMSEDFRLHLQNRVMDEFDIMQKQQRESQIGARRKRRNILPFNILTVQGLSMAAATLLVVVGVVAVFANQDGNADAPVGTTPDNIPPEAIIGLVVIGVITALGLYFFNRRNP